MENAGASVLATLLLIVDRTSVLDAPITALAAQTHLLLVLPALQKALILTFTKAKINV